MDNIYMKMCVEHWWNYNDRGKPNYLDRDLSQVHFVHHKSHMEWPHIETEIRSENPATEHLSNGTEQSEGNNRCAL